MCMHGPERTVKWRQLWQGLLYHLLPLALDSRCCGEVARARLQQDTTFGLGGRPNTAPLRPHGLHTVLHPCCIMLAACKEPGPNVSGVDGWGLNPYFPVPVAASSTSSLRVTMRH